MTDSDGIVAGHDLSCFRITWKLRCNGVNRIGLVGADLVRANKQSLRVGDIPVDSTSVGVVGAERRRVEAKSGGVDSVTDVEIVRQWIALVDEAQQRLVPPAVQWIDCRHRLEEQ